MEIKQVAGQSLPERILDAIGGLDDVIQRVWIIKVIGTGYSNATVLAAEVESSAEHIGSGKYIIKVDRKKESKKEAQISSSVATTTIARNMAHYVATGRAVNGYVANLLQLAHHTIDDSISLGSLLHEDIEEALKQIGAASGQLSKLQIILFTWYCSNLNTDAFHPYDLVRELLGTLLSSETSGLHVRLKEFGLEIEPEKNWIYFVGGDRTIYSNPVAYAYRKELWDNARGVTFPTGYAHGDLHLENIICARFLNASKNSSRIPVLIDFNLDIEKDKGYPLYDLAYFEFSVLKSLLKNTAPNDRKLWINQIKRITSQLDYKGHHTSIYYAIRHVRRIVINIQKKYASDESDRDIEISFWIAAWAAGLNFLRKQTVSDGERLLALIYATFALNRVKNLLRIDDSGISTDQMPSPISLDISMLREKLEDADSPDLNSVQSASSEFSTRKSKMSEGDAEDKDSNQTQKTSVETFAEADGSKQDEILDPMLYDDIKGWSLLSEIMEALPDVTKVDLVEFRALYNQAMRNRKERSNPTEDPAALDRQYDRIMQRTEEFILKYLPRGWSFIDLAWGKRPDFTSNHSNENESSENAKALIQERIRDLFYKRERVKRRLELEKQFMGGRTVPTNEDELRKIEFEMRELQKQSADAWLEVSTRIIKPTYEIYQDQPIRVQFIITNLGYKPTRMHLLPAEMKLIQHARDVISAQKINIMKLSLRADLQPRQRISSILPPIYFSKPGKLEIMPIYNHEFKHLGWDIPIIPHTVDIHASTPPQLIAKRYYRQQEGETLVQIRITNIGQQIAYKIKLSNQQFINPSQRQFRENRFQILEGFLWGTIAGSSSNILPLEYRVATTSLDDLELPVETIISWQDSEENTYEYVLDDSIYFLEFDFSQQWEIPERKEEIDRLLPLIQTLITNPSIEKSSDTRNRKQFILISGDEGSGKSKFVESFIDTAKQRYRISSITVEGRNNSDLVRDIFNEIFKLWHEDGAQNIKHLIEDLIEADEETYQNIAEYISYKSRLINPLYRDKFTRLVAKIISQLGPLVMVINDVHKLENSNDYDALREFIFTLITDYSHLPFAFIVTQTTNIASNVNLMRDSGIPSLRVNLKPIGESTVHQLIDSVIFAPKLSPFLKKYVSEKASGNLQYLSLYLRWLTADGKYIKYTSKEWEPSEQFMDLYRTGDHILYSSDNKISDFHTLLLETIERSLSDEKEIGFLFVLAVVGNDLPPLLISELAGWFGLDNRDNAIKDLMTKYREIDLIEPRFSDGFRFKSDLIRESIYLHFFDGKRVVIPRYLEISLDRIRVKIIEILQAQDIFDPLRNELEIAHHASKLSKIERKIYIEFLLKAADIERSQANVSKSIQYLRLAAEAEDKLERRLDISLRLIDMYFDFGAENQDYRSKIAGSLQAVANELPKLQETSNAIQINRIKGLYWNQQARWLYLNDNNTSTAYKAIEQAISYLEGGFGFATLARNSPFFTRALAKAAKLSENSDLVNAYLDMAEICLAANKTKWKAIIILIERLIAEVEKNRQIELKIRLSDVILKASAVHPQNRREYQQIAIDNLKWVSREGNVYQQAVAELELLVLPSESRSPNTQTQGIYLRLRDVFLEVGDYRMLAEVYCRLAKEHYEAKDLELALDYAKRALRYIPLVNDFDVRLDIISTMLDLLEDLNSYNDVLEVWDSFFYMISSKEFLDYLKTDRHDLEAFIRTIFAINDEISDVDVTRWQQLSWLLHQIVEDNSDIELAKWIDIEIEYSDSLLKNDKIREAIEVLNHAVKRAISTTEKIRLYESIGDIYASEGFTNVANIEFDDWGIYEDRTIGEDIPRSPVEVNYEKALDLLLPKSLHNTTDRREAVRIYQKMLSFIVKHPDAVENFPITYYHLFRTRGVVKNFETQTLTVSDDMVKEQISLVQQFSQITADYFIKANLSIAAAEVYVHSGNLLVPYVHSERPLIQSAQVLNYYQRAEQLYRTYARNIVDLVKGLYMLLYGFWMLNQNTKISGAFIELVGLARKGNSSEEFIRSIESVTSISNLASLNRDILLTILRDICYVRNNWQLNLEQRQALATSEAKLLLMISSHYGDVTERAVLNNALRKYDLAQALYGNEDSSFMSMYFNDTAVIHQALDNLDEADTRFAESLNLKRQLNDPAIVVNLLNYGELKYRQGEIEQAKDLFIEARTENDKILELVKQERKGSNRPLSHDRIIAYMRSESHASTITVLLRNIEAGKPYYGSISPTYSVSDLREALLRWQGSLKIVSTEANDNKEQ